MGNLRKRLEVCSADLASLPHHARGLVQTWLWRPDFELGMGYKMLQLYIAGGRMAQCTCLHDAEWMERFERG